MKRRIVPGAIVCAMLAGWAAAQNVSHQLGPDTVRLIPSIEGPALYRTYCAVCHGNSGTGGGPMAMSLRVQPSDLTRIAARNGGEFPLARVEKIIAGDEEITRGHGTQSMPLWGPIFSQIAQDRDLGRVRIRNLAMYLKSIQAK